MRFTALALVAMLAAGCGGDDAEETLPDTRPAPRTPAVDTTIGDTTMMGDTLGAAAADRAQAGGQRSGQAVPPTRAPGTPASGESGAPTVDGQRLYTIQVAAFTEAATAREWADRLRRQGLPVWTSMAEPGGRTFYRVRAGAVPTVAEARRLGTMISERYNWPVWVAPLTAADRPPEDAVQATRRLLEGG
jgi:cell division septation protein DedD